MGEGQSKPDPVPMALNMYVTNKTQGVEYLFVRVRGDKLREDEMYSRISSETSVGISAGGNTGVGGRKGASAGGDAGINVTHRNEEENRNRQVFDCLTQGGFNLIPLDEPKAFALENVTTAYISVSDGSTIWGTDMPISPQTYCCVTVKGDQEKGISIQSFNPKPRWIQANDKNVDKSLISQGLVEIYSRQSPRVTSFLGKVTVSTADKYTVIMASYLCGVHLERGELRCLTEMPPLENVCKLAPVVSVDVLGNPGYEWVKAQRGNPIPPNAVKTSVYISKKREERYVGRLNGEIVCGITAVDGMIDYFIPYQGSKTASGEILLLTSDPDIPPGKPAKLVGEKHNDPLIGYPQEMEENENETEEDENEMKEVVNENSIMSHFRAALSLMKKRKRKISLLLLIVSTSVIALTLTRRLVFVRSARSPSPASWANLAGLHLAVFSKEQMN